MFGKFALSGLLKHNQGLPKGNNPFVKDGADRSGFKVIVAGKNFGCGSSREHASICLKESGIEATVAPFYSRIFFRNSVNGGYLVPLESEEDLSTKIQTGAEVELDLEKNEIRDLSQGKSYRLKPLGDILPILEAGNVFEYAKKVGMLGDAQVQRSEDFVPEEPADD